MRTMSIQEEISQRTATIKNCFIKAISTLQENDKKNGTDYYQRLKNINDVASKEVDISNPKVINEHGVLFITEVGSIVVNGLPIDDLTEDVFYSALRVFFWDIDDNLTEGLSQTIVSLRLLPMKTHFTLEVAFNETNAQEIDIVIKE